MFWATLFKSAGSGLMANVCVCVLVWNKRSAEGESECVGGFLGMEFKCYEAVRSSITPTFSNNLGANTLFDYLSRHVLLHKSH